MALTIRAGSREQEQEDCNINGLYYRVIAAGAGGVQQQWVVSPGQQTNVAVLLTCGEQQISR